MLSPDNQAVAILLAVILAIMIAGAVIGTIIGIGNVLRDVPEIPPKVEKPGASNRPPHRPAPVSPNRPGNPDNLLAGGALPAHLLYAPRRPSDRPGYADGFPGVHRVASEPPAACGCGFVGEHSEEEHALRLAVQAEAFRADKVHRCPHCVPVMIGGRPWHASDCLDALEGGTS